MAQLRWLALVTAVSLAGASCGSEPEPGESAGLAVVVTTTIWGDIVSNVTGPNATVEVLYPIGADAHDYQLSAAQVASMQQADLVVVNGLGLEEGVLDVIESLEADGANVLEIAGLLDPLPLDGPTCDPEAAHDDHDAGTSATDGGEHDEVDGSCDPHVWMDPLRVAEAAELIGQELAALDPSVDWMTSAATYAEQLRSLDAELASMLAAIPEERRKLVTNHEAFGYFADRYGFQVLGAVIPGGSTLADPSSSQLADLVAVMSAENVDVIFAETVEPAALAEAVAAEVGAVSVVELFTESLGGPGSGAETYIDLIRTNVSRVADALS